MSADKPLPFVNPEIAARRETPKWFAWAYVFFIALAAFGDYSGFKGDLGTYFKAFTVGCIALAVLSFLYTGDTKRLRGLYSFAVLFFMPLLLTILISLLIWAFRMGSMSNITRGLSKLLFQFINIFTVLSGVYMFGKNTLKYLFAGLAAANGMIALMEMLHYGIPASIQSLVTGILSGGEAGGFFHAMEIHDITFAMGLFVFYFLVIEKKNRGTILRLIFALFFFIMGYKRIAFLGFAMALIMWVLLEKRKLRTRYVMIYTISIFIVIVCFAYVLFVKSGMFTELMGRLGVDTQGRDKIYAYISQFYEVDPRYLGYGFEYIVALLRGMWSSGTSVIHVTGLHNDILKQYIELGFWGYWMWLFYQYIYQIRWCTRDFGEKAGRLVLAVNLYTIITYMTDNTLYYFWLSMSLRMIMIGYAYSDEVRKEVSREQRERGFISDEELSAFAEEDEQP